MTTHVDQGFSLRKNSSQKKMTYQKTIGTKYLTVTPRSLMTTHIDQWFSTTKKFQQNKLASRKICGNGMPFSIPLACFSDNSRSLPSIEAVSRRLTETESRFTERHLLLPDGKIHLRTQSQKRHRQHQQQPHNIHGTLPCVSM